MRNRCEAATGRAGPGGGGTVRSMYEAALREVEADPVAAVTKYQPNWLAGLSPHYGRPSAKQPLPEKPRRR